MLYPFFCADEIKAPLPFYNTIGMFNNGLPLFINIRMRFNVLFILLYVRLVFTALNKPSFFIFSTQAQGRAIAAGNGFIMLYIVDVALLTFDIPVTISE
jgi:hypothetical protein